MTDKLVIKGKVKEIFETQTYSSGFAKREFVITTNEQYSQDVKFEVLKEKCDLLNKFSKGNNLEVSFNVRGNEYQGKYYVSLQAWQINKLD